MGGESLKLIELVLIFGGVIAWCAWELYKLKQDKKKREAAKASAAEAHREASDSEPTR